LTCENCYIESSPSNDRLSFLTRTEVNDYLDEIQEHRVPVRKIGITGGEPFMNPDILGILEDALERGFSVLVLTNAMRPMMKFAEGLEVLNRRYGDALILRVSVDHYDRVLHEQERGPRSWAPMVEGLQWLAAHGFSIRIAGRLRWNEDEYSLRQGFAEFFARFGLALDAQAPAELLLFPEMDEKAEVPEISTACWDQLGVNPADMMCASARMIVKRREVGTPEVVACTLLPYQSGFSFGNRLVDSLGSVALNHPHCARFCVLGGGNCSG
jgi:pyruvate-formate lyase-activating enzyme